MKQNYYQNTIKVLTIFAILLFCSSSIYAQCNGNPTASAQGFTTFLLNDATITSNENEGTLALGGNLTLDNIYTLALNSANSYIVGTDTNPTALVVGGRIFYISGNGLNIVNGGFVKIGDLTGSNIYDTGNTRITPGGFDSFPRIELSTNQSAASITENSGINFVQAFNDFQNISSGLASISSNNSLVINTSNNTATINLIAGQTNYFTIDASVFMGLSQITWSSAPNATTPVIFNFTGSGTITSDFPNIAGLSAADGRFVLYNYSNFTAINLQGSRTVYGTLYAPFANVNKSAHVGNIEGQVIALSLDHDGGEIHNYEFSAMVNYACSNNCQAVITPYYNINSAGWNQGSTVNLECGDNVTFGPQPISGSWTWTGPNGFTANTREITLSNVDDINSGIYTANYIEGDCNLNIDYTVSVSGCSVDCSGNADVVISQTGVINPNNSIGAPDGLSAQLYDTGDQIVLDLTNEVSAGENYTIRWRRDPATGSNPSITVEESANGSNWTSAVGSPFSFANTTYFDQVITANTNTRFIRITSNNIYNLDLDAISYSCSFLCSGGSGPDSDSDGINDVCDLDKDNDGILDTDELRCDQPAVANSTSGSGIYQDQLYIFNWNGPAFNDGLQTGDSQTFTLADGTVITAVFSNVTINGSGGAIATTDFQTWPGAYLHNLYNTPGSKEAFYGNSAVQSMNITLNISAVKNGMPFRLDLLALDAESTNINPDENWSVTTNGSNWELLEQYNGGGVWTGVGTPTVTTTDTENSGGNSIFYSEGVTQLNYSMQSGSNQRQGFAIGMFLICDTDNDGIPNYVDTDSDNDGCPDALEGDGGFTYSDLDGDVLTTGTDIDSNGVPLEAAGGQNDISAYDDTVQAPVCECSPGSPTFTDNDGDGVGDICDLDDDNDGILDTDEGCEDLSQGINNVPATYALNTELQSPELDGIATLPNLYNGLMSFTATVSGTAQWGNGVQIQNNATIGDYIYLQPINTDNSSTNNVATYTFDFTESVENFSMTIGGLNYFDYVKISVFNDGVEVPISDSNFSGISSNITLTNGNELTANSDTSGGTDPLLNLGTFSVEEPIDQVVILSGKADNNDSTVTIALHTIAFCVPLDSDNDGIPNYLDTDSDNDGCPDAVEGDGSYTLSELNENDMLTGVDADGDGVIDGVGQGIGDSQDETINSGCCIELELYVYLEGSLIVPQTAQYNNPPMRTTLNSSYLLPGQFSENPFSGNIYTPAGQPYSVAPWSYLGTEGNLFDSGGNSANAAAGYAPEVVDWVLVSLRTNPSDGSEALCQRAGLLYNDGHIEFPEYSCCELDNSLSYYIVIEHRNHLIIMSDSPVTITNGSLIYDFRDKQSYLNDPFGSGSYIGQKEVIPGIFAMYAGNGDQTSTNQEDTDITASDQSKWLNNGPENRTYNFIDYNMDGDVSALDYDLWQTNSPLFTSVPRN